MINKGWVGIFLIILFFSVGLIVLSGFVFVKYNKNFTFNNWSMPKNSISETSSQVTVAPKLPTTEPIKVTTLPPVQKELPKPTPEPTPVYVEPCYNFEIKSGELKSKKCYSTENYDKITGLYSDYDYEVATLEFTEDRIKLTCDGSEFFKDSCMDAKNDLASQKSRIEKLKSQIKEIILKGK